MEPKICEHCKKEFVPLQAKGKHRKYCYDPKCERIREREHAKKFRKVNKERLALLSKKFTKGLSEKEAKLLVKLHKRVSKMCPRVTKKEWDVLKKIEKDLEHSRKLIDEVDKLLAEKK